MKYSNELKVGLVVAAAVLVFVFGYRFLRDLPLFGGSYPLATRFDDASGLVSGNPVHISGVRVGSVESVRLGDDQSDVEVRFSLDEDTVVPRGSTTRVTGVSALGGVQLVIVPGPPSNPPIEPGGRVPAASGSGGGLGGLADRAPSLLNQVDSLLAVANGAVESAGTTFEGTSRLLADEDSDLRRTLAAIRRSTESLDRTLNAQEGRLNNVLANAEATTGDLRRFTEENTESMGQAVDRLNSALARLNGNLAALDTTTANLNAVTTSIARGEGTLGRLVNDPSLYVHLDSTSARLSSILEDFKEHPERYIDDLTLIEIF